MLESLLSLASYRSSDRRNPSFLIAVLFHALVAATLWAFSFRLVALVEQELVYPWYYPTIPVELTRYESPPPAAPAKALNDPAKPSAPEPAPQVPESLLVNRCRSRRSKHLSPRTRTRSDRRMVRSMSLAPRVVARTEGVAAD